MKKTKKEDSQYKWVLTVFVTAVVLSAVLSLVSESILDSTDIAVAVLTLTLFIGLGIVFDVIGVAATAADPKPFHSMAAHRERGHSSYCEMQAGCPASVTMWWGTSAALYPAPPAQ